MHLHRLHRIFIYTVIFSVCVGTGSLADDTDIYLTPSSIARDDSPNVLIILDTSGSMEDNSITTTPSYDPTATYTGSYDTTRIYWSSTNNAPNSSTNQWITPANNSCTASAFHLGTTAGAQGYYSDKMAGWIWRFRNSVTSTTQGQWATPQGGTNSDSNFRMGPIDCKGDDPADASLGTYLTQSNNNQLAYTGRYTNNINSKLDLSNFATITLYSGNYLNYRANPPGSVTKTRMQIAKEAINTIIDTNRNVRLGLMVFNRNWDGNFCGQLSCENGAPHGGRIVMKIDNMDDARRTSMKNLVNSLTGKPNGISQSTPLAETMWEAYRYLGGLTVQYGDDESGATPTRDATAEDGSGKYVSPFKFNCQKAFIIYVTDGDPQMDTNADDDIKTTANQGSSCASGDSNFNFSDGKSCLDELSAWMNQNDINTSMPEPQTAVTFTIGFGTGLTQAGLDLLKDTAEKGGGKYFTANNAEELNTALQGIMIDIQATTTSFVAPALSVNAFNRLFNRDDVYFAMFKPSGTTKWEGNVKKFKLNAAGDVIDVTGALAIDVTTKRIKDTAKSYWSATADGGNVTKGGAGAIIPPPADPDPTKARQVYTYTGTYPIAAPVDVTVADHQVVATNTARITSGMLGFLSTPTTAEHEGLINWIRGQDVFDENGDGSTTDTRWGLADPLHSRPVAITYGGSNSDPVIKLFFGTNDGMIHMMDDKTGIEEWAFIPKELLENQYALSSDDFGTHIYGMDGTSTFWVQDNNNNGIIEPENATGKNDRVYMFMGMRRGGRNLYAFDITPTVTLTSSVRTGIKPKLMWVIRGGVDTDYMYLGQTWSKPAVAKIHVACSGAGCNTGDSVSKTVLIFGGGYNTLEDYPAGANIGGNAIFIVDPLTGQRIWWASSETGATLPLTNMTSSIPSDLALVDTNADGAVDRIFTGDMAGRIWRIDLSPTISTGNNGSPASTGYILANLSGSTNQEKRKFFYPPDWVQVTDNNFYAPPSGDSADYDAIAIVSGNREDPLDILTTSANPIRNQMYVLRDTLIATGPVTSPPSPITHTNLYDATNDVLQDSANSGYAAALDELKGVSAPKGKGWYINLVNNPSAASTAWQWVGEKGLAKTTVFAGTLFATTYTPPSITTANLTCAKDEGLGKLYALDLLSGRAVYDYNKDTGLTIDDRQMNMGGGIPSELVIVIRETGVSGLVGTSGGANKPDGIPSNAPWIRTYWYEGK